MDSMLWSLTRPPCGESFSASGENVTGAKGAGGRAVPGGNAGADVAAFGQIDKLPSPHPADELGQKFKVRPWIYLAPHVETPLLDVDGPGVVRHIWITTPPERLRALVLRIYWEKEELPSVAVPLGDFFCNAAGYTAPMTSLGCCVNPRNGMNFYLPMPFCSHARITVENLLDEEIGDFYYTVNFTREEVPADSLYFHAAFRRSNPLPYGEDFTILDGVKGSGRFAGCYMTWQQNNSGWWGEGEIKMFVDGDGEFPSICGTGTEDYFGGAWCFNRGTPFSSPYSGYPCGGENRCGMRHSLYRFHLADPIYFHRDLKVTMQALGWRSGHRFLPLQDDISATAYWYQTLPHQPLPELPDRNGLEVI